MARALITGSSGFVGPHLQEHLLAEADEVTALNSTTGPDLRDLDGWTSTISDIGPDVIYHLAGWSDVGASWNDPVATAELNAMGTLAILEAVRNHPSSRLIFVSSAEVYGRVDPSDLPLRESVPTQPVSPYGGSKLAAEALALQYSRGFGLDIVITRPFNHIGPGQASNFVASAFARQIAEAEITGEAKLHHGNLSAARDITDVRDVVRAYRLLADHGEAGQIYNICSGSPVSIKHLLDTLLSLSDLAIQPYEDPNLARPIDLPILTGSPDKLIATTEWNPRYSLHESLEDVLVEARSLTSTKEPK